MFLFIFASLIINFMIYYVFFVKVMFCQILYTVEGNTLQKLILRLPACLTGMKLYVQSMCSQTLNVIIDSK